MNVIKNFFWNISYQLLAIITPIIIIPYINSKLGPTGVGINSYTNSLAQMFTIFGDLGVINYGTKTIAEVRNNRYLRSKVFLEITVMRFFTILLSYSVFLFFIYSRGQYIKFYLLQGIIILASTFDISWFYMGIENFKVIAVRNFIVRILTLILILTLIKNRYNLGLYIFIMSSSNVVGNLSMFPSLHKWVSLVKISSSNLMKHLKYAIVFFIPQIAMQIYQTFDKFIIGNIVNVKASGFFDSSDKIMNLLLTIIGSLGIVMLPHISHIFHDGTLQQVKDCFYKYFDVVLFLSMPMTAGVASISIKFAPWFFGQKFAVVGPLMMIESITIFIIGMSLAFSSYFMSTNQVKQYNIAIVLGSIVSLTIGIYLIYQFGLIGSMLSADFTESFITIYEIYILRKQLNYRYAFKNIFSYLIGSISLFIPVFLLNTNIRFNIISLFIETFIGFSIYILVIYIMKPTVLPYITNLIKRCMNKVCDIL